MHLTFKQRTVSQLVLVLFLCSAWGTIFNIGMVKAESNSLIAVGHFTIQEVLDGIDRDFFVCSFSALKGDWIKLNLSSYSTNNRPFQTSVRIYSANHGVIFGAEGPDYSQIVHLGYDDTYNITIHKSRTFSSVQFSGIIDVFREESSENWVEVDKFSGGSWWGGTRLFRIGYFEWRIRWNYEPTIDLSSETAVVFDIQVLDSKSELVELVRCGEKTNGTIYLYQYGEFYLYIIGFNTDKYTIIIEQNINSIPEFPSWTLLPLLIVATLVGVTIRNKIKKRKS